MTTAIDQLLLKIVNVNNPSIDQILEHKDSKILRSLASVITNHYFITENQARLLTKILKENSKKLSTFSQEIDECLVNPTWSRNFRVIDQIKKLYIDKNLDGEPSIILEFSTSSSIRKKMKEILKNIEGISQSPSGKKYTISLIEKNIVNLVDAVTPLKFDVSDEIKDFYNTIKSWEKSDFLAKFALPTIEHKLLNQCISEDIGDLSQVSDLIKHDRSNRYHYFTNLPKNTPISLTEHIAYRNGTKVYIDKKAYGLEDIINSLIELKRLPMMIVFSNFKDQDNINSLKNLSEILEKLNLTDSVGIYFRLPNSETGKEFNSLIKEKAYNQTLTATTQIVGVQNTKIPKFFLTNTWKPMSVIALDTDLRHGKTATFANNCDLIISYTESKPLLNSWLSN